MRKTIAALTAAGALAVPAAAGAITHAQAMTDAQNHATDLFQGAVLGQVFQTSYCNGPYENVAYHTQWACYGIGVDAIHETHWQINLDPWNRVVYKKAWF